ncbi:hypothetical protein JIN85_05105 [Luteolibacter pohnpeiensis]|uniref:Uncharacterized protein n=1 Tax=Luteolibacter pohnpeiensis TaxID=454153 RepID=A0A934VV35_9BACT|nr:hypothetical protein [Luteolibacter pohnpeiensis]MBK1881780.1 hypothetical protein [Luteolibacter pohnpeiensis]
MKSRLLVLIASVIAVTGCEKKAEVVITQTRPITSRDANPKLFATSDERFRDAKPSPVKGVAPENWLARPASQFRLLNYTFGPNAECEVYVSISQGGVLENVNRWLKQFDSPPLTDEEFRKMRQVRIADTTGVWVEAEGEYKSGMAAGGVQEANYALAGVIANVQGQILTVKMIGPASEVQDAKPQLEAFAASLHMVD